MTSTPADRASSPPSAPAPGDAYARFLPWKRRFEVTAWLGFTLLNAVFNSITVLVDVHRVGLRFRDWEPVIWEFSSGLVMLAMVPTLAAFTRRHPLGWQHPWPQVRRHALGSIAFCLTHVLGMVALRSLAYRSQGLEYDFGNWPVELGYEYLKDVRSYATLVLAIEGYRLVLRRLQGEASLLTAPDDAPAAEPVDRPERFLVRKLGREFLVPAADIEWVQASGNYVNLRVRGHDYPLRSTIGGLEARLDSRRFARVHRSYIVNLDLVASIQPLDTGDARIHLRDGGELPCSRKYRSALRERAGLREAA